MVTSYRSLQKYTEQDLQCHEPGMERNIATHTLADGRVVTPFRNIGMKRMFGLASTVVGVPYGTVEAFKAIHDVTEEEMAALRRFVPGQKILLLAPNKR